MQHVRSSRTCLLAGDVKVSYLRHIVMPIIFLRNLWWQTSSLRCSSAVDRLLLVALVVELSIYQGTTGFCQMPTISGGIRAIRRVQSFASFFARSSSSVQKKKIDGCRLKTKLF